MTPTDTILLALQKEHDAMLDPLDIPRSWTGRELNDYEAKRAARSARIDRARSASAELADLTPKLAPEEKWRDLLTTLRSKFCADLRAVEPNDRATWELQQGLTLSISNIDRGCSYWPNGAPGVSAPLAAAIQAAGYLPPAGTFGVAWFGCLSDMEDRIADLKKRIAKAQAQLADALMSDADRETKAKEDKARLDAFNAMSNEDRAAAIAALDKERAATV